MSSRLSFKLIIYATITALLGCTPESKDLIASGEALEQFKEKYKTLVNQYSQYLKANPQNIALRIQLAEFYYNFKDYQKTKELLEGLDIVKAKVILAKALVKLKKYNYAIEIFEQLKPLPEDSEYLYLYGEVLEKKNLFPKAIEMYSQVKLPFKKEAQERIKLIKAKVEEEVPAQIKEFSQNAENFLNSLKDAAAVYLLIDEEIQITSKNTSVSTIHVIEKVLKERGKELAEVEIGYDSTYRRVELEFARTITKEGKVHYVGEENIRDVSRYLNYPLYSNSRAFIISMPSVDVGSFIEYKVKIYSSKLINEDDFNFIYRLREKYPIFKARFRLIASKKSTVHFKFFNRNYAKGINLEPSVLEEKDKKVYSWEFDQIKPIIPEYAMPPVAYINPAILISSFDSWDEIYKWWHSLYQDKIAVTDQMKNFLNSLIKDAPKDIDKARNIYEFVAKNIRYVAIEYGEGGYEPHQAQEVFINRYGDCKDQVILLVALLREAGLKAYPVLIPTDETYPISRDFPSLNFNHAICVAQIDGELIFMDPTAETTPFLDLPLSDQARTVLVFFDQNWRIVNTVPIKENQVSYRMDIIINKEEGARVTREVETSGFFAASYRGYLKYTHPALIKEDIQKKMRKISSLSSLINYGLKNVDNFEANPLLTYQFQVDKFLNPAGSLRIVSVLDQLRLDYRLISRKERRFPIDLEGFYNKIATIRIVLPDNLKVKYLPSSFASENPWFRLEVSYRQFKNRLNFYQKFTIKKRFVEVKDYQKFERYLEEAIYKLREEIILKKER